MKSLILLSMALSPLAGITDAFACKASNTVRDANAMGQLLEVVTKQNPWSYSPGIASIAKISSDSVEQTRWKVGLEDGTSKTFKTTIDSSCHVTWEIVYP